MLVQTGIATLALLVGGAVIALVQQGTRSARVVAVVVAVMTVQLLLARSGMLSHWDQVPPPILPVVLFSILLAAGTALSPIGARMATHISIAALVGVQSFRLPLELLMHRAAVTGVMPVQMSYSGWNFDIITGATAVIVAWLAATGRAPRALLLAWNGMGTITLTAIVAIAVASMPMFAAFGTSPNRLNTWIAGAPYVWLPGVLVPAALLGHLVLWRRLLRARL